MYLSCLNLYRKGYKKQKNDIIKIVCLLCTYKLMYMCTTKCITEIIFKTVLQHVSNEFHDALVMCYHLPLVRLHVPAP